MKITKNTIATLTAPNFLLEDTIDEIQQFLLKIVGDRKLDARMNKWKRRYLKLARRGVWERCYYADGRLAYWKVVPNPCTTDVGNCLINPTIPDVDAVRMSILKEASEWGTEATSTITTTTDANDQDNETLRRCTFDE